jgi:flavin-dependent dehydrogenase
MLDEAAGRIERAAESAECDVLVVGGGPAGSTVAALLAALGRDVVVVEKAQHPRFHIGESLLPANLPLFDRLGLGTAIRDIGLYKPGAEFVSDHYGKTNTFFFATASHLISKHAYQVRRSVFDQVLFENCRARGARTVENTRVTDIDFDAGERPAVSALANDGAHMIWRPRFVIDASGRDTFMASKLGIKTVNKRNNTAAIFGHFMGVPRREGDAEGIITAYLVDDGWFWMIPLPDGQMSVGLVGNPGLFKNRAGGVEALFWDTVRASPSVAERMRSARLVSALATTGNYSYTARTTWGDRFLMIGDAFTFVDPIFSTGIMIAMTSGVRGADIVDLCLREPQRGRRALRVFERQVRQATARLTWLIYRINDPVFRYMLMHPSNRLRIRDGLLSLLAGEIFDCSRATRLRVLVFKLIYHALRVLRPPELRARPASASRAPRSVSEA